MNEFTKSAKIIDSNNLKSLEGISNIVLAGGCFDILHFGHLTFLENAKKQGEALVVLLESDEFIRNYKKREPLHNQEQRSKILSHLDMVDFIIILPVMNSNEEYFNLVKSIKPSIIAVTEGDSKIEIKQQQAQSIGALVKIVTSQLPFSSSTYASLFRY